MSKSKSEQELFDWLSLARTDGIGPITFFGLLAKFGDAKSALTQLPKFATKLGAQKYKAPEPEAIEAEIKNTHDFGGKFLLASQSDFPKQLAQIAPPPPIISVIGNISLFSKPTIGIVGARNASGIGIRMAREIASGLGAAGFVVASGLARGIDGAAHIASLNSGTIGVVAGGIDHIYPPEHCELYHKIKENGLIVSENPFGAQVFARDFPRRNRIISGLSMGIIVIEAEEKSGSLITARYALEQNREVMAVPGSPLDPRAYGPNALIKDGAALITSAQDVIACFEGFQKMREPDFSLNGFTNQSLKIDKSSIEEIAALLSPTPISLDELSQQTGLPWRTVAAIIVELELDGRAFMRHGNMVASF